MLVPKEIIRPGTYWYVDTATRQPRKLPVTVEDVKHYCEAGNAMLAAGLSVPVPLEHDPEAKTLTTAEKAASRLRNNTGWVNRYSMQGDRLYAMLDIQDMDVYSKLPRTIKYTSPWLNSFTDGNGRKWDNVISHVALTSRPRIIAD